MEDDQPPPTSQGTHRKSLALASISHEDYATVYWPQLRKAVDRLLEGPPPHPPAGPPLEFEPMYSAVYKCVCQQHSEALYHDLTSHLTTHYRQVAAHLQSVEDSQLIDKYFFVLHRAMYSLDGIIPIFTYLNRVYVVHKLSSDLRTELQKLFCTVVVDPVFDKLIGQVRESMELRPLSTAPHVLASFIKNLYKLNPAYALRYPQVFAGYIPGVLPAMKQHELMGYISETRQLQASLRQTWATSPSPTSQGQKRGLEDELLTQV